MLMSRSVTKKVIEEIVDYTWAIYKQFKMLRKWNSWNTKNGIAT